MNAKGSFGNEAMPSPVESSPGSRRGSSRLLEASFGGAPQLLGVPRRPQSVPPKPSSDASHEMRTAYYERSAQPRFHVSAEPYTKAEANAELFFVTDQRHARRDSSTSSSPQGVYVEDQSSQEAPGHDTDHHDATPSVSQQSGISTLSTGSPANLYTSISHVLQAKALDFRKHTAPAAFPAHVLAEESAGIFMGQLPSSYSEEDIECLLRALGRMHGKLVHVRDVKSHLRDRTCAFVMVNVSSVAPIIDFSKRVLCDMNNVWVVSSAQASALLAYINTIPRQQLRGVPKLPLVLERLTHSGRSRRTSGTQSTARDAPRTAEAGSQTAASPLGVEMTATQMMQMMPMAATASRRTSLDSSGSLQSYSATGAPLQPFNMVTQANSLYPAGLMPLGQPAMYGVPTAMPQPTVATTFQPMLSSMMDTSHSLSQRQSLNSRLLGYADAAPRQSLSSYSQMSVDPVEATGQPGFNLPAPMATFGSRKYSGAGGVIDCSDMSSISHQSPGLSRPSQSSQLGESSLGSHADPMKRGPSTASFPVTSIPASLPNITCSCGQFLRLSVIASMARCAQCQSNVEPNMVAYWCPNGHLCVCTNCGVRFTLNTPFAMHPADPNRSS